MTMTIRIQNWDLVGTPGLKLTQSKRLEKLENQLTACQLGERQV